VNPEIAAAPLLVIFVVLSVSGGFASRTAYYLRARGENTAAATTLIASALFYVGSALFAISAVLASKAG
jgi:uncharacterized membrane protein YtjA (UPF0391 family)